MSEKKTEKNMCGERERERDDSKVIVNVKKEREKRVCMCAREIIYESFFVCVSGCLIK